MKIPAFILVALLVLFGGLNLTKADEPVRLTAAQMVRVTAGDMAVVIGGAAKVAVVTRGDVQVIIGDGFRHGLKDKNKKYHSKMAPNVVSAATRPRARPAGQEFIPRDG